MSRDDYILLTCTALYHVIRLTRDVGWPKVGNLGLISQELRPRRTKWKEDSRREGQSGQCSRGRLQEC